MQRARGHAITVVAGVVLLATSFVPLWATYRVPGLGLVAPQTSHQNAWTAYGLTMQVALAAAAAALALALTIWLKIVTWPRSETLLLALCAVAAILLVWQVVRGPSGSHDPGGYGIERGLLVFTGAALAAAMTYGSYLTWKETAPAVPVRG